MSGWDDGLPTTVDDALRGAARDVLDSGEEISTEDGSAHLELFSYRTGMSSPLHRIAASSARRLDLVGAVGRLVWMLRGDDALGSVAFYVQRSVDYSPDGIWVPGSDYGARIRKPLPGVDQLHGVIKRLTDEPLSRQAGTVIWNPLDAVREPFDVPCAFGTLYHRRRGGLAATTVMRSNKPSVLPLNFFEFSMLAEVVAAELELPLVRYEHWTAVMQIPHREYDLCRGIVGCEGAGSPMPPMPRTPAPLGQVRELCVLEARVRSSRDEREVNEAIYAGRGLLHPYWFGFLQVLALGWYRKAGLVSAALDRCEELPDHFAAGCLSSIKPRLKEPTQTP
ncbi:thymidylate synthase [Streptomyces tendae]|uniref:thymidylate synthase n=1 Tax=Streptomyces tendae TaxID=1932 RepID=UPI0033C71723